MTSPKIYNSFVLESQFVTRYFYMLSGSLESSSNKINIFCRFHLGFLTDQFDASLILLKRDFCWDHADIFYKAQEVGGRRTAKNVSSLLPLTKQGRLTPNLSHTNRLKFTPTLPLTKQGMLTPNLLLAKQGRLTPNLCPVIQETLGVPRSTRRPLDRYIFIKMSIFR